MIKDVIIREVESWMPSHTPPSIARDNHYVQQALLRRWSVDGNNLWVYRTLVSHAHIPEWARKAIRGIAVQNDLYTVFSGGQEIDDFEQWIQREYEDPGLEATEKIVTGGLLTPVEWTAIQRYVAAQDLRTPLTFKEDMERWKTLVPSLLNEILKDLANEAKRFQAEGVTHTQRLHPTPYSDFVRAKVRPSPDELSTDGTLQLSMRTGRKFWVVSIRQRLIDNANIICGQRWSVIEPYGDEEWPLTDHPVVRLNYYRLGQYDFKGGWGNTNSELFMPVSPRHLLYVKVGSKAANRPSASKDVTRRLQRFLVERAHRWIFARQKFDWVESIRPRVVSQEQFVTEQEMWKKWREEQLALEKSW